MLPSTHHLAFHQARRRLTFEPSGASPRPDPIPLGELFEDFLVPYRYTGSPRTLEHYEHYLGRGFFPWLAARDVVRLDQLDARYVERYLVELTPTLAPVTVRKVYNQISRFSAWCVERRYLHEHLCQFIKAPQVPEGTRQAFEDDELRRISIITDKRSGMTGTRDRAILGVLLDTGARAAELVGMDVEKSIDWTRHRVLLHGKGKKDRWVPIGAETQRRLRVYLRVRPKVPLQNLWLSQRRGAFTYVALIANLHLLGEYAGVEDCTPHRFRHTFATQHYRAHHDLIALQSLLGHASVEMTMRYLRQLGVSYGAEMNYRPPGEWLLAPD